VAPQAGAPALRFVVVLWGEAGAEAAAALPCPLLTYEQVLQQGAALLERGCWALARWALCPPLPLP
jgi:hypothetical protein